MSKDLVDFSELSDDAKQNAITDFAKFYIELVRKNDMELITSYDKNGIVQDINRDLFTNQYNTINNIIKDSVSDRSNKYGMLLENIDQKFFENGNPELEWPKWYAAKYQKIARGL